MNLYFYQVYVVIHRQHCGVCFMCTVTPKEIFFIYFTLLYFFILHMAVGTFLHTHFIVINCSHVNTKTPRVRECGRVGKGVSQSMSKTEQAKWNVICKNEISKWISMEFSFDVRARLARNSKWNIISHSSNIKYSNFMNISDDECGCLCRNAWIQLIVRWFVSLCSCICDTFRCFSTVQNEKYFERATRWRHNGNKWQSICAATFGAPSFMFVYVNQTKMGFDQSDKWSSNICIR